MGERNMLTGSWRAPDQRGVDSTVVEGTHSRHRHVIVGDHVKGLVRLQVRQLLFAEELEHLRVPDEISLDHRGGGEPLEEIRLYAVRKVPAPATAGPPPDPPVFGRGPTPPTPP